MAKELLFQNKKSSEGSATVKSILKIDRSRAGTRSGRARVWEYQMNLSLLKRRREMKNLKRVLLESKQESAKLKDQLLRSLAEFDNYRKRTEREYQHLVFTASASLVKDLLPVVDDLDRSLKIENSHQDHVQFRKGVQMIYDKFMKILETRGVQSIDAVGQPFDTERHEALMQVEKRELPSNSVVEVYEKGYLMHDKILRHAKVVVNK